jgi:hypothetical protein
MAINPYQFESAGGYGLGTSTNYGGNDYGYDIGSGMLGIDDPASGDAGFDLNLKRPKKPNIKNPPKNPSTNPAYEPVTVTNTNPNFNTNFNPLGILGTIGGVLGGVLGGQQQGQGNVSPQGAVAGGSSGSEQSAPQAAPEANTGVSPSPNRDLIGDNMRNAYSKPRDYSSLYASPALPTIGYGDAGAAQAAASQAGAGSVTPEQSSQWRMEQAQAANRAAYSTPRDYSSLSSQFKSPELPTIGYDNPQAAGNAAYSSGDWKPAPGRDFSRLNELREQRESSKETENNRQRSGWDAFANWTSENVGSKFGAVVDDVEEGVNPANWKYTDPSGNTYTGAAAAAMATMYGAAGAVAGNDLASQMFLLYYDE